MPLFWFIKENPLPPTLVFSPPNAACWLKSVFVSLFWNPLCVASKTLSSCSCIKLPRRSPELSGGVRLPRAGCVPACVHVCLCLCLCGRRGPRDGHPPAGPSFQLEALTASFRFRKLSPQRHSHAKEPHNCWQGLGGPGQPDGAETAFHYYNTMP